MRIRDCLLWLWGMSRSVRGAMLWSSVLGVVQVSVSLYFVFVCKQLIDTVSGAVTGRLDAGIAWMLGCLAAQLGLSALRSRLAARTEIVLRNGLRSRLFNTLMASRWTGRETLHTGDVLNRLEEDVRTVSEALCRTLPGVLVTGVQLCGALFFLSRLDARLAGTLLFIMPLALLFSKRYVRRMRRLSRGIRATDSRVQSHLQEHLEHRVLIRTLEYTSRAEAGLDRLQDTLRGEVMARTDFSIFSRVVVQLGFSAGYATAFLWGLFGLRDGTVTFGMMAAFLQLVAQVQRPMVDLSRQIPMFIRVFTSAERLAELQALPAEEGGAPVRLSGSLGVRFESVDFAYPGGDRNVLDGFSHDFRPGSLTAVVGETGAGKSTLLRLVLALLLPDRGRVVFYDGRAEAVASPRTRCNLSYVPQGNTLLSGTIRDNLLMGRPDATDEELWAALHVAAADFVRALPEGLDTLCGERGAGLSEGQTQRIAVARGLLRPGGLLLLDEPTSSLDGATEQLLLERLAQRIDGKTLIIITHREAVAERCSSVLRLSPRAGAD